MLSCKHVYVGYVYTTYYDLYTTIRYGGKNMCDIEKEERVKRYMKLREAGHTPAWARRVRDFSDNHMMFHIEHEGKVYE